MDQRIQNTYVPSNRIVCYIDKVLRSYSNNVCDPNFPSTIPINLQDYAESKTQPVPPSVTESKDKTFPNDVNLLTITQRKITHMDAVNRALCKTHELDGYILPALIRYATYIKERRSEEEKQKGHSEFWNLINGLRQNFVTREKFVATNTAITTAIHRRDNCYRIDLPVTQVLTVVSRSIEQDRDKVI